MVNLPGHFCTHGIHLHNMIHPNSHEKLRTLKLKLIIIRAYMNVNVGCNYISAQCCILNNSMRLNTLLNSMRVSATSCSSKLIKEKITDPMTFDLQN